MSERTQRADERRERLAFLKALGEVRTPVKRGLAQALEASLVKELECAAALGTTPPELAAALAQAELEAYGECLTSECLVSTMACGARTGARPLLGELYTIAEPVAREASKRGHATMQSMSPEVGWNFYDRTAREDALTRIDEEKPFCLILAFPCADWRSAQCVDEGTSRLLSARAKSKILVDFAVTVAERQLAAGRHFVVENPTTSRAWKLVRRLSKLASRKTMYSANFEQCMLGAKTSSGQPTRKGTRFLTSSREVMLAFQRHRCDRQHEHVWLHGREATNSAVYPRKMASELVSAIERQWSIDCRQLRYEALVTGGIDPKEAAPPDAAPLFTDDFDYDFGPAPGGEEEQDMVSEEQAAEAWKAIGRIQQNALIRMHNNTGHRAPKILARALAIAGAP